MCYFCLMRNTVCVYHSQLHPQLACMPAVQVITATIAFGMVREHPIYRGGRNGEPACINLVADCTGFACLGGGILRVLGTSMSAGLGAGMHTRCRHKECKVSPLLMSAHTLMPLPACLPLHPGASRASTSRMFGL